VTFTKPSWTQDMICWLALWMLRTK